MNGTVARFFAAIVLVAIAVARPASADDNPFQVRDTTLPNGLHLITDRASRVPIVSVFLAFRVGAAEEPANRVGLTSLTLALMTHRTKHVRDGELFAQLDSLATQWNFGEDEDYAFVSATVAPEALERVMWLFSDMTGFFASSLDQAEVDQQVALITNTQAHADDVTGGLAGELAHHALFPEGHPYHRVGEAAQLHGVTASDVAAFHARWFVPRNAHLTITGMVDPDEASRLAAKYFGTIPSGDLPRREFPEHRALAGETRIEVAAPVSAGRVAIQWPTPRHFAPGDGELDGVANVLDGVRLAHLRWELAANKHLVTSISAAQRSWRDASAFQITATIAPGHTASEVVDGVDDVLRALLKSKLEADDVRAALLPMLLEHGHGYERSGTRAFRYAQWAVTTNEPALAFFGKQFGRYGFDGARMLEVAAQELPLDRRVISWIVPDASAPRHGVLRSQTFKPAGPR